jgi:hypothetical protein
MSWSYLLMLSVYPYCHTEQTIMYVLTRTPPTLAFDVGGAPHVHVCICVLARLLLVLRVCAYMRLTHMYVYVVGMVFD